jgi:DNA-binding GntR family transcriptional regulator
MAERGKISSDVATRLRDEIIAGELAPGAPLRMAAIADRLGVSVTPVREALVALERQGLVSGRLNRGFVVNTLTPTDFEDVYAIHAFMAARLAERAVRNLSDRDIDELQVLGDEIQAHNANGDVARGSELYHEFNRRVFKAGESQILRRFLSETTPFVTRRRDLTVPGWEQLRAEQHTELLDAFRARDAQKAGRLMAEIVQRTGEHAVAHEASRGRKPAHRHDQPAAPSGSAGDQFSTGTTGPIRTGHDTEGP